MAILFAGDIDLQGNNVLNVATPTTSGGATPKSYVDGQITGLSSTYVAKTGDSMSGLLTLNAGLTVSAGTTTTQALSAASFNVSGTSTQGVVNVSGIETNTAALNAQGRLRAGFNTNVSGVTSLATSAAEFELSSQSMVAIGENTAGSANPHLTMYRTNSGNRVGTSMRQFLPSSNGPFKWQWNVNNGAAYGAETYTDAMTLDLSGNLTTTGWANVASLQTGGTQRLDGTGALLNISSITASGLFSSSGQASFTSGVDGVFSFTGGSAADSTVWLYGAVAGTQKLRLARSGNVSAVTLNLHGGGDANTGANTFSVDASGNTLISGTLGVTGNTNVGPVMTFANPGVGNDTSFIFNKTSDSAGITVNEVSNDATWYAFTMADNPDGGDQFTMQWTDWQTAGSGWSPFFYTGFNHTEVALNHYFAGSVNFLGGPFFTSRGNSTWGNRDWVQYNSGNNTPKLSGTGTLNLAVNCSGYTGSMTVYWVILDSATTFKWGTGNTGATPAATGVAITGAAQTLSNGLTVTFSGTTGGVTGDTYAWRVFPAPTMTVNPPVTMNNGLTVNSTLSATGLATFSGGDVRLTNTSSNTLQWYSYGVGSPSFNSRSAGTKAIYWSQVGPFYVDYAVGIEASTLWHSVPDSTSQYQFKWYGGTSVAALLTGAGALTLSAGLSATTGNFSSTLGVTGATTLAGMTATTGSFSSTLGVTGATTLAGMSATTGSFSSTLGVTGFSTLTGGASFGASSYGTADNTFFSWDANSNQLGFSKKATVGGKLAYASNPFVVTEYVGQTTISPANAQTDRLTIATGGAVTINQSLSVGTTLNVTGAVTLTAGLTGANIAKDTITGGAASGAGNIASQTIQDYNVKDASISYSKLTGTAQSQIVAFSTQDSSSQFMREVSATGSSLDANSKETDGLTVSNSATRVADTLAYRGQAITNTGMTSTGVTAASGPGYTGLQPGQYQATVFLRKSSGTGTGNILTIQATGTAVTGSVITVTDTMLTTNYQGIVVPFTVTSTTNSVNITITNSILPGTYAWNYSHVRVVPNTGQITSGTVSTFFANASITSAQINTILASQIATGTLTAQSIYLGTSGHVYGGVTAAPTGTDSYIDLNSTGMQGVVSGTTVMSLTSSGLSVTGGTIGGYTVTSSKLSAGSGATTIALDTANGISLGASTFSTSPFRVSLAGALTATNATITGAITATQGAFLGPVSGSTLNGLYSSTINLVDTNSAPVSTSFWSDLSSAGAATVTQVTGTGSSAGGNAIQFAYTATARTYSLPFLQIARTAAKLKTGATYTVSWYARSISGDLGMNALALCHGDGTTNLISGNTTTYTLSASWTRYSVTFVAQLDSDTGTGFYWPRTNISTASTFQIAGVQIELGSTASAYVDGLQHVQIDSTGLKAFDQSYNQVTSISSSTGALTASNATISGAITATSGSFTGSITSTAGTIGGFTIGSTTLNVGGTTASSVTLDSANGIYLGGTSAAAPFRVTTTGALTATSATITGTVTSTSGTIGGFTLSSTSLTAGSGGTGIGMDTGAGFWAGAATSATAPFSVSPSGVFIAKQGTFGGTVAADRMIGYHNNLPNLLTGSAVMTGNLPDYYAGRITTAYWSSFGNVAPATVTGVSISDVNVNNKRAVQFAWAASGTRTSTAATLRINSNGNSYDLLKGGITYTLSFYALCVSGDTAMGQITIANSDGTNVLATVTPGPTALNTSGFVRYSFTFTPTADLVQLSSVCWYMANPANAATWQITQPQIEVGSTATAFIDGSGRIKVDQGGLSAYDNLGSTFTAIEGGRLRTYYGFNFGSSIGITTGTTIVGTTYNTLSQITNSGNLVNTMPAADFATGAITDYWKSLDSGTPATITQVTGTGSGVGAGKAAQYAWTAAARTSSAVGLLVDTVGNRIKNYSRYMLTWYARWISGDTTMGSIAVQHSDGTNTVLSTLVPQGATNAPSSFVAPAAFNSTGSWVRYQAVFMAQADSDTSTYFIWNRGNPSAAQTIQVTGVQIEPYNDVTANTAQAYTEGSTRVDHNSSGIVSYSLGQLVTSITSTGLTATAGTLGGFTITSTTLNVGGTGASSMSIDSANGIYLGGTSAAAPFRVSLDGTLTATNANITGTLTSSAGTIGGFTLSATTLGVGAGGASSLTLDTANGFYAGGTSSTAPFKVSLAGTLTATTATITNLTVSTSLSMSSQKITNLATPTASTDAATKGYVDTAVINTAPIMRIYSPGGSYTWTKPAGLVAVRVVVIGGGGGGGGATGGTSTRSAGGGGGSGAYSQGFFAASALLASESVTVGSGGAGGAAGANTGITGGTSSFGSHITCLGGGGGTGMAASTTQNAIGGAGAAVPTGGTVNSPGAPGMLGLVLSAAVATAGGGASSALSGGAHFNNVAGAGNNATGYGGGGGGGHATTASFAGGNGAAGVVIVEEYY